MSGIRVILGGRDQAFARLHELGAKLDDARPMYDEIGGWLESSIEQNFLLEKTPDGNPWPKSLRSRATGGQTLTDTANLRRSITRRSWNTGVVVGSISHYAAIHQFGGTIKAKTSKGLSFKYSKAGGNQASWARKMQVTIPARPFIGMDDADEAEIIRIAEDHVGGRDAR